MIIDVIRDEEEFKKLFNDRPMQTDLYSLNFIKHNPHLYCFYGEEDGKLYGFIFITEGENKRLSLNGVAKDKILPDVVNAIITVCNKYKRDIYSDTDLKHAQFALRRAGFKQISKNLFLRRYK